MSFKALVLFGSSTDLLESSFGVTLNEVFFPINAKTADLINIGLDINVRDIFQILSGKRGIRYLL